MTMLLVLLGSMWGIAGGLYMDLSFPRPPSACCR
jgi:hypothetical protein